MIDLHTHTTYSDGTDTPLELLQKAEKLGITTLSITDHDNVDAYHELRKVNIKDYYTGDLVVGCEFNCNYQGIKIELLGYNFGLNNVSKWLDINAIFKSDEEKRRYKFNTALSIYDKQGVTYTKNITYSNNNGIPLVYLCKDLKKYEVNKEILGDAWDQDCFHFDRLCTGKLDYPLFIPYEFHSTKTISDMIRANGGLVFFVHPYIFKINNHLEFIDSLRKENLIDGIECYYPTFTKEQTNTLVEYCKKHNLLISGGSDYHGTNKPVKLGEQIVPEEDITWV